MFLFLLGTSCTFHYGRTDNFRSSEFLSVDTIVFHRPIIDWDASSRSGWIGKHDYPTTKNISIGKMEEEYSGELQRKFITKAVVKDTTRVFITETFSKLKAGQEWSYMDSYCPGNKNYHLYLYVKYYRYHDSHARNNKSYDSSRLQVVILSKRDRKIIFYGAACERNSTGVLSDNNYPSKSSVRRQLNKSFEIKYH